MTELSRGGRNWKFLLTLAVLLVIFLFPLVHGLISGVGAPDAAPATPDPGPATVDILAVPGPGPAAGFDACSVLSPDVVDAAGPKYSSGIVRAGPEPGRAPGTNSCGARSDLRAGVCPRLSSSRWGSSRSAAPRGATACRTTGALAKAEPSSPAGARTGSASRPRPHPRPGRSALPAPIGDFSCASPGTGGRHQILFRAGRDRVLLEYRADHPSAGDLAGTARKIFDALPH